jgi:hypothetical protein
VIPALYVASNKDKSVCKTVTVPQYYDPSTGEWHDARDNDYNTLYMDD